ncbi:MAG: hypothetical protein ACFFAT_08350 [Promethearchaeota archaeon]
MAEIDPKTGMKIRKLTELRSSAAEEYQEAMMKRVKELHIQENKVKDVAENTIVRSLSTLLDLKLKVDEMLGDNKEKIQKAIENILLAF